MADAQLLAELLHRLDRGKNLWGRLADATKTSAEVIGPICGSADGAVLPIRILPGERGMAWVGVVDAESQKGAARYRAARRAVLKLLAETEDERGSRQDP